MSEPPRAPAATLVIFGATGDLARRLLMPALVNLARDGLLDPATRILGVSNVAASDDQLRDMLAQFVEQGDAWERLRAGISYMQGDFGDAATFSALAGRIKGNAVFYLAVAPSFFGPLATSLGGIGLLNEADGFRRIVIEKPFGHDLSSAQALNAQLLAAASEPQIFRIDHFLGKETVQNVMVARFANPMLEAVWNGRYIDHVQITVAESVTVGTRGKFYDATGALRDMVPNHLFQLLSLVAMEPPNSFDAEAIRTEKAKVIEAVCPIPPEDAARGRYTAGRIGDTDVADYRAESDVDPASRTETYVALRAKVETWRWADVPFYLRTGKALTARDSEIVIQFRAPALHLFRTGEGAAQLPPNRLVLQIQPDEAITAELVAKVPGPETVATPISLDFRYADHFKLGHRTGYETLLYDVLTGDQTLFQRADQIEGGWRAVEPLLREWGNGQPQDYAAGSAGPADADALLARDGRQWHQLG